MNDTNNIDHPRMIFGAVGLAMGVATLVLSILNAVEPDIAVLFLSISVICFGISALMPKR